MAILNRYQLRLAGNSLVSLMPTSVLRMFLKTFESRPELAEAAGFHVHPRRFDSPLPIVEEIDKSKLAKPRLLPGVHLPMECGLPLIKKLRPFAAELDSVPYDDDGVSPFWFNNGSFTDFDAAVLYSLLRHIKPARFIEVGCGVSSRIGSLALQRNRKEGAACRATYIDPEPRLPMSELAGGELIQKRVQDVPLEIFKSLQPNDVLFIDTSHVLKIQSDVEHELLRILPSLPPKVWIHVHDVFTPYDYPEEWIWRPVRLPMNEQYALECLLSGGGNYEIELPIHLLVREYLPAMKDFFPRGRSQGQSIWIRKVQ